MKRGPVIRAAALVFVVLLIGAMFLGCAKFDGDQAEFCRLLPKAPSFQSLMLTASIGTDKHASQTMSDAARDFRSLEQSAPRSIRAKVAALGDSAERISRRLADPSSQDSYGVAFQYDAAGTHVPMQTRVAADRTGVFYSEFSAHPGTAAAAYSLLAYAQVDCGIKDLDSTLGLNGYGSYDSYSPYGTVIDGGNKPAPTPSDGSQNGVTVIPPASTAPPGSSIPALPTTTSTGVTGQ